MNKPDTFANLEQLEYIPYLDATGNICADCQGKIGVYAIFDREQVLEFIGYSRDIYLSLKQHLARQPHACYWLKIQVIERPNRTILESIKQAWLRESQAVIGNEKLWTEPIDAKLVMTDTEKEFYQSADELGKMKLLKQVSRRVENDILSTLEKRGVQMEIRFNPKLKEQGLLDLK
ncbi:Similar to tr/Q8YQ40/Q8YQ40 [Microcystis aeruginosa PCC 9806]|uniref:GIY-YIG nuclease family protein n=2 Tax=Microcystis TaxID=1125 RepID=A0A552LBC9_9CHRO|nr:GIY-YIG nuclease family protein [Microcystis aeruginosa]TRV17496.1 MAG: GIY-YIG nuclease family protein [Microcystis flos-aquae Mf_WU_F_19750830_S460]CCI12274.1 Similar to tr/Q8YQ40/Q8YQ40 [Microcystis aeruginosa PCC 9806]